MEPLKFLQSINRNKLSSLSETISAWWKRQNLSVKTNLGVLSLLIVLFSVTGYILLGYFSSILISNAERRGEIIGSLFAKINNLPLDYTDYFVFTNTLVYSCFSNEQVYSDRCNSFSCINVVFDDET